MKIPKSRSVFFKGLTLAFILLFSFSLMVLAGTDVEGSPDGLPCPGGGPDFRAQMQGSWPVRLDRIGEDTRGYAGFDIGWFAQCTDPASSGALQKVLDAVNSDPLMTQCNGTKLGLDSSGNIPLCGNDGDSYIGISGGNWIWSYYDTGSGSSGGDTVTGPDSGATPGDLTNAGTIALAGKNPSLAFDPVKKLWLVVSENGGKIQGQFMTDKNKLSGSVLNVGGSDAHMPKISYGTSVNKYLVVWTSGKDPSAVLWGQLVSEEGSTSGSPFKIATGGAHLYGASNIQFDSFNKNFVLAYEKAGAGVEVMLVRIDGAGTIAGPTKLANVSLKGSAPSVAINPQPHEYCVTYLNKDSVKIQSVSDEGVAGSVTEIGQGKDNAGIVFNADDNSYTAAWLDSDGAIGSKTLADCSNDPEITNPDILADKAQAGILVQNNDGFGLFVVDPSGTNDKFMSFDSSGNQLTDQTIFSGTWKTDGFWLAAAPNTLTGLYAAVASPDTKSVKFVSGIGVATDSKDSSAIPKSTDYPVPSKGLPTDLGQLISVIFTWSLSIIGLVIFVRFFYAGVKWAFFSAGNSAQVGEAKEMMKNAVYGALVLFSAYLILNTINPDLVHSTFNMPGIPGTQPATNNTPTTPSSCFVYGSAVYASQVTKAQNTVLGRPEGMAEQISTPENEAKFIQLLIKELKDTGYDAGLANSCDGKGTIPLSIMVGHKATDKNGEVCTVFRDDSSTIRSTLTAYCTQHADWKQLAP